MNAKLVIGCQKEMFSPFGILNFLQSEIAHYIIYYLDILKLYAHVYVSACRNLHESPSTQGFQKRLSDPVVLVTGCGKPPGVGPLQDQEGLNR